MIALVEGNVVEKFANSVVVETSGIGYEILVASNDYSRTIPGEKVRFYTYHHVREQSEELFGFSSLTAKRLFELLITVQGVGPKAALAILSLAEVETVQSAIAGEDSAFVAKASGVGKKTAERVTVDLRDKVGAPLADYTSNSANQTALSGDEALDALMALGYNLADATTVLSGISRDLPTAERVKLALRQK